MKFFHASGSARTEHKSRSLFREKAPMTGESAHSGHKSHGLFWRKVLMVGAFFVTVVAVATLNAQTPKAGNSDESLDSNIVQMNEKGHKASPLNQAKFCDLAQLCQGRVAYFGDTHVNAPLRAELIAQLPELKKAGFTHLAVEMEQKDLANYSKKMKEIKNMELAMDLIESFGPRLESLLNQPDADSNEIAKSKKVLEFFKDKENVRQFREMTTAYRGYYELLDSARSLGFTIVAADSMGDFDDKMKALPKTMGEKGMDNLAKMLGSLGDASEIKGYVDSLGPRNRYMARKVSEILANPNNRVLVFLGAGHVIKSGVPALVSEASGESGPTIEFSYDGSFQAKYKVDPIHEIIQPDVSSEKWNAKRFALPADAVGKGTQYDWYFHLPEETK